MNRATKNDSWVKNPDGTLGFTSSPITGCLNHTPEGLCLGGMFPCFAYGLANGRLKQRYLVNDVIAPYSDFPLSKNKRYFEARQDPFYPRFWSARLMEILARKKPAGIFLCIMGELFGDWIPRNWQGMVFSVIKACPQHRFYLLTKQPQNLIKFSPFPENCYVGVTATGNKMADIAQRYMLKIEAKVKYLSLEPFLEHIQWEFILGYNQVIIGAQTKPYKPPELERVYEIVQAADKAGIPLYLKGNLESIIPFTTMFRTEDRKLRQEMPV